MTSTRLNLVETEFHTFKGTFFSRFKLHPILSQLCRRRCDSTQHSEMQFNVRNRGNRQRVAENMHQMWPPSKTISPSQATPLYQHYNKTISPSQAILLYQHYNKTISPSQATLLYQHYKTISPSQATPLYQHYKTISPSQATPLYQHYNKLHY
jgi:hypothetical protein